MALSNCFSDNLCVCVWVEVKENLKLLMECKHFAAIEMEIAIELAGKLNSLTYAVFLVCIFV